MSPSRYRNGKQLLLIPKIKTKGNGPTASLKATPARKSIHRTPSNSSLSSTTSEQADKAAPQPPATQPTQSNGNAWSLSFSSSHSICNRRPEFTSFRPIAPLINASGTVAHGVGTVCLDIRKHGGETSELILTNVLFVPDRAFNTIAGISLWGKDGSFPDGTFDEAEGILRDKNGRVVACFSGSDAPQEGLWYLELVKRHAGSLEPIPSV